MLMPYYTFAFANTLPEGLIPGYELMRCLSSESHGVCGIHGSDSMCEFF